MSTIISFFSFFCAAVSFQVCIAAKPYVAAGKRNEDIAMAKMIAGNRQGKTHEIQHLGEALPP